MSNLEQYGIKDVGFEDRRSEGHPIVSGYLRYTDMLELKVQGEYIGRMWDVKRVGRNGFGGELWVNSDTHIWLDKLEVEV